MTHKSCWPNPDESESESRDSSRPAAGNKFTSFPQQLSHISHHIHLSFFPHHLPPAPPTEQRTSILHAQASIFLIYSCFSLEFKYFFSLEMTQQLRCCAFSLLLFISTILNALLQHSDGFFYPEELAQKLLLSELPNHQTLTLVFTGDTQYHYPCTDYNVQCKERARNCTEAQQKEPALKIAWPADGRRPTTASANANANFVGRDCMHVESEFANEVQRKCIFHLIRLLEQRAPVLKPAALFINGDLTNFGHSFQLELFKSDWLRTIPVPVLIGLGNHDFENNVNDCMGNNCAERMLRWFSQEYVPAMDGQLVANLDLIKRKELWRARHEGSLAYSSKLCATAGNRTNGNKAPFCVFSLQLHNRPDYAASIEYPTGQWQIRGSFQWLHRELSRIADGEEAERLMRLNGTEKNGQQAAVVVLINLHNHGLKVGERLRGTLEQWHHSNAQRPVRFNFMVLFAHIHENHSVAMRCVNGRQVPHIFVGSVPNNRFTTIRFHEGGQRAEIFLFQANANSTAQIVQTIDFRWLPC